MYIVMSLLFIQINIVETKVLCNSDLDKWGCITLKAPVTTAADGSLEYFSLFFRENKT